MKSIPFIFTLLFFSTSLQAELLGLVPGRTARVQSHAHASIEIGASWYTNQLRWTAIRFNIKPSRGLTLFADYAKLQVTNVPVSEEAQAAFLGGGIGGGVFFVIPDFFPTFDVAIKGAYHASVSNERSGSVSHPTMGMALHQRQLNADLIFSPIDPILENGLSWYGSVGYVSTDAHTQFNANPLFNMDSVSYRQKSGWAFGAGIVMPFKYAEAYSGIAWMSRDPLLTAGIRYSF